MLVCQIQTLQRDHQDNCEEEKHVDKEIKSKSHRHMQTERRGGDSMFMTPHSHLDHCYTQKRARMQQTTHRLVDLFKSQELCLSFRTSCS